MAYDFKQQASGQANNGTSISTAAFGSSLTAGSLLVGVLEFASYSTQPTLSFSGTSATWVEETPIDTGGGTFAFPFYALNITGSETTALTISTGAITGDLRLVVAEFGGIKTSGARLAFAGQKLNYPGSSTDAITSGLLGTLSAQPALLVAFCNSSSNAETTSAGTSFTGLSAFFDKSAGWTNGLAEHRRLTATTSVAGTFTSSPGDNDLAPIAWAFEEGAGGGSASGSGAATLPILTAAGTGTKGRSGTGAATLPILTASGTGTSSSAPASHSGSGAVTLPILTAAGTGKKARTGTGSLTLPELTADGTGAETSSESGSGAATLPILTAAGTGSSTPAPGASSGNGAATLPMLTAAGTGSVTAAPASHSGQGDLALPLLLAGGSSPSGSPSPSGAGVAIHRRRRRR